MEKDFGYVQDVCADLETGRITSIIVPGGNNRLLNFFSSENDIVIDWNKIKCIGEDLILVEIWFFLYAELRFFLQFKYYGTVGKNF